MQSTDIHEVDNIEYTPSIFWERLDPHKMMIFWIFFMRICQFWSFHEVDNVEYTPGLFRERQDPHKMMIFWIFLWGFVNFGHFMKWTMLNIHLGYFGNDKIRVKWWSFAFIRMPYKAVSNLFRQMHWIIALNNRYLDSFQILDT